MLKFFLEHNIQTYYSDTDEKQFRMSYSVASFPSLCFMRRQILWKISQYYPRSGLEKTQIKSRLKQINYQAFFDHSIITKQLKDSCSEISIVY